MNNPVQGEAAARGKGIPTLLSALRRSATLYAVSLLRSADMVGTSRIPRVTLRSLGVIHISRLRRVFSVVKQINSNFVLQ